VSVEDFIYLLKEKVLFKTSKDEVIMILKSLNEEYGDKNIMSKKVSYQTFIEVIDILKREKLVVATLLNSMNYTIFVILIILIVLYIYLFYN
jgi:hypothetical protein